MPGKSQAIAEGLIRLAEEEFSRVKPKFNPETGRLHDFMPFNGDGDFVRTTTSPPVPLDSVTRPAPDRIESAIEEGAKRGLSKQDVIDSIGPYDTAGWVDYETPRARFDQAFSFISPTQTIGEEVVRRGKQPGLVKPAIAAGALAGGATIAGAASAADGGEFSRSPSASPATPARQADKVAAALKPSYIGAPDIPSYPHSELDKQILAGNGPDFVRTPKATAYSPAEDAPINNSVEGFGIDYSQGSQSDDLPEETVLTNPRTGSPTAAAPEFTRGLVDSGGLTNAGEASLLNTVGKAPADSVLKSLEFDRQIKRDNAGELAAKRMIQQGMDDTKLQTIGNEARVDPRVNARAVQLASNGAGQVGSMEFTRDAASNIAEEAQLRRAEARAGLSQPDFKREVSEAADAYFQQNESEQGRQNSLDAQANLEASRAPSAIAARNAAADIERAQRAETQKVVRSRQDASGVPASMRGLNRENFTNDEWNARIAAAPDRIQREADANRQNAVDVAQAKASKNDGANAARIESERIQAQGKVDAAVALANKTGGNPEVVRAKISEEGRKDVQALQKLRAEAVMLGNDEEIERYDGLIRESTARWASALRDYDARVGSQKPTTAPSAQQTPVPSTAKPATPATNSKELTPDGKFVVVRDASGKAIGKRPI